jgi:hypothetical protein
MTPQQVADRLVDICSDVSLDANGYQADLSNCDLRLIAPFISAYDSLIAPSLAQLSDCPDVLAYYSSLEPFLNSVVTLSITICFSRIALRILSTIFSEI